MKTKPADILTQVMQLTAVPTRYLRAYRFNQTSDATGSQDAHPAAYRAPLRLGMIICAAVVLVFGSWSVLASISGAVVAVGKVSVGGQVQTVQHLDGGVVSNILVRDGDVVAKGSILLRLESISLQTELSIAENRLYEVLARRARLEAERDGRTSMVRPSEFRALDLDHLRRAETVQKAGRSAINQSTSTKADRLDTDVSSQGERRGKHLHEGYSRHVFNAEVRLFHARRATRAAQIERLKKSIGQAREQVIGLRAQRESRRRQQALIKRELRGATKLHKKGLSPLTRLLALERQASEIEGSIAGLTAEIAAISQKIGELEVEILKVEKDWQEMVLVDLRAANLEHREYTDRRASLLDKLQRVDLRAPVSGTVNHLAMNTVGGVIRAAEPVMDIVPRNELLVVEAFVAPAQIDRLHEGQTTRIRLSAFNANTTPVLVGSLTHVSADLIEDTETKIQSYLIRVRIPRTEIARLGDKRLISGMPAELFVETGNRSPMSYLLKPLSDQIARATKER